MAGKAQVTEEDIARFPPEMQKQIREQLRPEPAPDTPQKPREWWQVDAPPRPVQGTPISPQKVATKEWYKAPPRPIVQQSKPLRRKRKSHMIWYILLAYALLIALCIIPGLIYQLK
jgi:hypothetical protein